MEEEVLNLEKGALEHGWIHTNTKNGAGSESFLIKIILVMSPTTISWIFLDLHQSLVDKEADNPAYPKY